MDLRLDPDELNACVQCGLCLPHCPTYRVTGDETLSPRGRIKLMREVQDHDAPVTETVIDALSTCVQCRGCEPACPSQVPYGRLIEQTRETLADSGLVTPWWQRLALKPLSQPVALGIGAKLAAVAGRTGLMPDRLGLPRDLPWHREALAATGDDVYFFTGCVMDALQRDVHAAGIRVLKAAGFGARPTGSEAPCCGALHTHAGLADEARSLARRAIAALEDDRPIVVDSAGCGAAMKDYGHALPSEEAQAFAARVVDIGEFLADHIDRLPERAKLPLRVAIQDPCHLRHVQKVHGATRQLLKRYVTDVVELDDDGLCCGAGGAYSVLEPELASQIRRRKISAIDRARPDVVVSANPGCSMHLASELSDHQIETLHPVELIDRALSQP